MNRLRVLKHRAKRGFATAVKYSRGWGVASGLGQGDFAGPFTRRQAIQLAARWAMPAKRVMITITVTHADGSTSITSSPSR